jgi:CheY-like chemotaxis protein
MANDLAAVRPSSDKVKSNKAAVREILDKAKAEGRTSLTAPEGKLVCEAYDDHCPTLRGSEKSPALLVVDDDPDAIALIQSILLPEGYHLLLTSCVAEAFELLARHEVGVVLCDQLMPEMSGVEFLSKVRSMYPDAMRVLMSAYDMRISKLRAKPLIAGPSTSLWANRGRRGS